jgi:hypothetical protein
MGSGDTGDIADPHVSSLEGELRVLISDHDDLSTQRRYFLGTDAGADFELLFDAPPAATAGARVRVDGSLVDTLTWHVSSMSVLAPGAADGVVEQDLVAATPEPPRQVAFLVLNFGTPDSLTIDQAQQKVFTASNGMKAYFREESYGIRNIDGKVLGPFTVSPLADCNLGTGGGLTNLANQANAAMKAAGEDPAKYQHVLYYFPRTSVCPWAGLAFQPGKQGWYNGASSNSVLSHELGHNFFLFHASSLSCKDAAGAPVAYGSSCTPSEYGDRFDTMGSGNFQSNVYQKAQQGWFGKCNLVTVGANDTFDLVPTELASNGVQALRVVRDAANSKMSSYYVEYRQTLGAFDTASSNGVFIHVAPAPTTKEHPFLLDMTPATNTFADAALPLGGTFSDPDGKVKITLVSRSAASAQIRFEFPAGTNGASTCLDGTRITGSGGTPPPTMPPPGTPDAGTDSGTTPPPATNVKLVTSVNGKCLDVNGAGTADGTNIQEWTCNGSGAQSFQIQDQGGGVVRIVNTNSGKCVDVKAGGTADGTNVQLLTCNGGASQSFRMQDAGGGTFAIVNNASNKCVDIAQSGTADGTNVQLWTCNGTNAQRWQPIKL